MQTAESRFTNLDWIGFVFTAFLAVFLFTLPLVLVPSFIVIFEQMNVALPGITLLVTKGWFSPLGGLFSTFLLIGATRRRLAIGPRRGLVVGSLVLGLLWAAICLMGLYQPIFSLAGSVK